MELRHLLAVEAVLATGSFTAAAAVRHLSQPALWAQIKELEGELGLALFVRAGRGVAPTAACEALRPQLERALDDVAELRRVAVEIREGWEAPARIGCAPTFVSAFLAGCIRELVEHDPRTPFPVIVPITTASAVETLTQGGIDLLCEPRAKPSIPDAVKLYPVTVVAVGEVALTAEGDQLDVRALDGVPLATMPQDSLVRRMLQDAARACGTALNVVYESRDVPALLELARQGLCTSVIHDEMLVHQEGLTGVPVIAQGRRLESPIWLGWRREETLAPAARALRDTMIERSRCLQR